MTDSLEEKIKKLYDASVVKGMEFPSNEVVLAYRGPKLGWRAVAKDFAGSLVSEEYPTPGEALEELVEKFEGKKQ